jgi:hypothetical protein
MSSGQAQHPGGIADFRRQRLGSGDDAVGTTDGCVVTPPPALLRMWVRSYLIWGGGLKQHLSPLYPRLNLWRRLAHWQPLANSGRYIAVHDLVVTLVDAIVLALPVPMPRPYRWQEQVLILAQGRR